MLLSVLLLATLFLQQTSGDEGKEASVSVVEGKDIGRGFGYGYGSHHGRSHNRGYRGDGYRGYGGYHGNHGGHHGHYHADHKLVPIKIPYIDANGCRFPGEPVCDRPNAAARGTYVICLFDNESKNLWKKPTFSISNMISCNRLLPGSSSFVSSEFCNDNKRLLKAAGLIQEKDKDNDKYFHQGMFMVAMNPCFLDNM